MDECLVELVVGFVDALPQYKPLEEFEFNHESSGSELELQKGEVLLLQTLNHNGLQAQ